MSAIRKIASNLDGAYWNSNNFHGRRPDDNRAMFYENREATAPPVVRQQQHIFPRPVDDQREILHQLKLLSEQVQNVAYNQQCFSDSWQRYLQHFEENFAELRHMVQATAAMPTDEQQSVVVSTHLFEQPKQEQTQERDIAQTLLSLGEKQICHSLHGFQTNDTQNYYWAAHDAKTRNVLPISDSDSRSIEEGYQNLVRYGAHDHGVPHNCCVGDVNINFDSREGSVGNTWVRFARIKK